MAIKVNGTTVIDDNRNLVNIVSGAGSSTDFGAVGTYVLAYQHAYNVTMALRGSTISGGSLRPAALSNGAPSFSTIFASYSGEIYIGAGSNAATLSGTWRLMGEMMQRLTDLNDAPMALYVRIS